MPRSDLVLNWQCSQEYIRWYIANYLFHTQWQRYKDYLYLLPKSIRLSVWVFVRSGYRNPNRNTSCYFCYLAMVGIICHLVEIGLVSGSVWLYLVISFCICLLALPLVSNLNLYNFITSKFLLMNFNRQRDWFSLICRERSLNNWKIYICIFILPNIEMGATCQHLPERDSINPDAVHLKKKKKTFWRIPVLGWEMGCGSFQPTKSASSLKNSRGCYDKRGGGAKVAKSLKGEGGIFWKKTKELQTSLATSLTCPELIYRKF